MVVPSPGIEPGFPAPEASVLSIKRRGLNVVSLADNLIGFNPRVTLDFLPLFCYTANNLGQ